MFIKWWELRMESILKGYKNMSWKVGAMIVLSAFYGIYIGKMLFQKKKGIRTDQIAKGKKKDRVYYTELVMKIATYGVVIVEIISVSGGFSMSGTAIKAIGLVLGILGVIIFGIAVWTMQDNWRAGIAESDKTDMVTSGIYRFSRNPAFLGFDLVYAGIGFMFLNPVLTAASVFAGVMLHLQILQEEKYLSAVFGSAYDVYYRQTARYFGRKKWKVTTE